jgi:hypothetical protein
MVENEKGGRMKEIFLGLGIALAPQVIALCLGEEKQKAIGRNASKWLRKTLGKKLEQIIEKLFYNIVIGAMEDNNPECARKIKNVKKEIDKIKKNLQ